MDIFVTPCGAERSEARPWDEDPQLARPPVGECHHTCGRTFAQRWGRVGWATPANKSVEKTIELH